MNRWLQSLAAAACLMVPFPAAAQSGADASSESDRVAWAELGAGVGAVGVPGEGGMSFPSATARMNITRRIAVDASAAFDVGPYTHGLSGFYVLQAHQTFGAAPRRIAPFATYGVLGSFSYQREPEYRYVLSTGDTVVIPARTYRRMTRPLGILVGGGARIRLAQRAYAEAGAELGAVDGGVVVIARAGLTIPIGAGR